MSERPYYLKKKGPRVGAAMVVIRLRKRNPCMTLAQIGSRVGRTRERVRQILSRAGLPTRALVLPKLRYECPGCGRLLRGPNSGCRTCMMGTFVCDGCGKEFQRRVAQQRSMFKKQQVAVVGSADGSESEMVPGSKKLPCCKCGSLVWLSPNSQAMVGRGADPHCLNCVPSGGDIRVSTATAVGVLKQQGLPVPEDKALLELVRQALESNARRILSERRKGERRKA